MDDEKGQVSQTADAKSGESKTFPMDVLGIYVVSSVFFLVLFVTYICSYLRTAGKEKIEIQKRMEQRAVMQLQRRLDEAGKDSVVQFQHFRRDNKPPLYSEVVELPPEYSSCVLNLPK